MPSPIVTGGQLQTLGRTFNAAFLEGLNGATPITYDKVCMRVPMSTKHVDLGMIEDITGLREWIGDRQFAQLKRRSYTITAKKFEKSLEVSREDIEDDNLGLYGNRFRQLGEKVRLWPDQQVAALLELGETEKAYDDVAFFSASHPENGGTASNLSGSGNPAWYLFDTSRTVRPLIWGDRTAPEFATYEDAKDASVFLRDTYQYGVRVRGTPAFGLWQLAYKSKATLDATNFDAAITTMMQRKNDAGESLGVMPTILMVPPSLRVAARSIVNVEKLANGADNPNYKSIEVVVNHRLANT